MPNNSVFSTYADRRIASVFLLGITSGLPWVIIGSALTLWLKESGISRAEIGYAGMIFGVFAINFFWSPAIDRIKLPFIDSAFGQRQGWIGLCQLTMTLLCLSMALFSPVDSTKALILTALGIAVCAATQDIAIDAYRIDSFSSNENDLISTAAGAATAGWWTGYAGLGFLPLYLSDQGWQWPTLYLLMAATIALLAFINQLLPRPKHGSSQTLDQDYATYLETTKGMPLTQKVLQIITLSSPILLTVWAFVGSPGIPKEISQSSIYTPGLILVGLTFAILAAIQLNRSLQIRRVSAKPATTLDFILARFLTNLCSPIQEFFQRNGFRLALYILLFIFLFKIGEAFLGRMSIVFYKEIGFSNTEIASYSKMLTWWVSVFAAIAAGALNARLGLFRGLFISGVFMACSNLMFSWIALTGPSIPLYIATVIVDGVAASWSLVAFVAFISALCNHTFSASQYALLASLGALGRTTLSSVSGQVVDWLDGNWAVFFVITALMVIPSLLLLKTISAKLPALERDD